MRQRTKAREYALQLLYQIDLIHADPKQLIEDFCALHKAPGEIKAFVTQLVEGAVQHRAEIDALIATHADNWNLKRMAVVDRNILRMGAFELLFLDEVPPKVCLNEAVELAKRFGDAESGKFVNGILDTIHKTHARRPACAASGEPEGDAAGRHDYPPGSETTTPSVSP